MSDWHAILVIASHLSGHPIPPVTPHVEYVPHSWFVEHLCHGRTKCTYVGKYNQQDGDTVYLDEALTGQDHDAFLLHEFVHFLQHYSGAYRNGHCRDEFFKEIRAYSAQNTYAEKYQYRKTYYTVPPIGCTVDAWDAP